MTAMKVIVNPVSGRRAGEQSITAIKEALTRPGCEFDLVCTEYPLHAVELARDAALDGCDLIVAAGRDGTINEVINGIMEANNNHGTDFSFGGLTIGRGNDFAFGAELPRRIQQGSVALIRDKKKRIDLGMITGGLFPEGRYFGNGVGIGFDTVVGFELEKYRRLSGFGSCDRCIENHFPHYYDIYLQFYSPFR